MQEFEDLPSYLKEPARVMPTLVFAPPEEDDAIPPSVWASRSSLPSTLTEKLGVHVVNLLSASTSPFWQGQWVIWKGAQKDLLKGKLKFELQRHFKDAYTGGGPRVEVTIRVRPPSLKYRARRALSRLVSTCTSFIP